MFKKILNKIKGFFKEEEKPKKPKKLPREYYLKKPIPESNKKGRDSLMFSSELRYNGKIKEFILSDPVMKKVFHYFNIPTHDISLGRKVKPLREIEPAKLKDIEEIE